MTQEDLEQFGKLIEPLSKKLEGLEQGQKRLEKSIDTLDMKIEVSLDTLTKKIDQRSEQILETIIHTADDIINRQEPRISQIEEHLGLENPTKKN